MDEDKQLIYPDVPEVDEALSETAMLAQERRTADVRDRRQREEVEPPQSGRPAPHLTALARELGAIGPDQEARLMAEPTPAPGMPSQSYAVPYGTVRRLTELLDTRPGGWVGAIETLLEFTETVKQERDAARAGEVQRRRERDLAEHRFNTASEWAAEEHGKTKERLETCMALLRRVRDVVVAASPSPDEPLPDFEETVQWLEERLAPAQGRSVPSSAEVAASLAPDLDDVQRLRASMVRDLIVHAEMPPASVPGEVDRLVRYVLEGRP